MFSDANWKDIQIRSAAFGGPSEVIAKPALVSHLYGDGRLNACAGAILDWWLDALPEGIQLYGLGTTSRAFRKLGAGGIKSIRGALTAKAIKKAHQDRDVFYMLKDASGFSVGNYSLEFIVGAQPENGEDERANGFHFAWPLGTEGELSERFRLLLETFPFQHATASYGFDIVWGREGEQVALPIIMEAGQRWLGLDVRDRSTEQFLYEQVKGAGWLTFLNSKLKTKLGEVQTRLSDCVECSDVNDGILLRTGVEPPIGDSWDAESGRKDLVALREVNDVLRPIRTTKLIGGNLFRCVNADAWLSRLDEG